MGLASSVFLAGQENRVAFGVIDSDAGFLYGKTALYVARTPGATAKGPYVAPADVLVTDAPYRSAAGRDRGRPVRRRVRGAGPVRASPAATRCWP